MQEEYSWETKGLVQSSNGDFKITTIYFERRGISAKIAKARSEVRIRVTNPTLLAWQKVNRDLDLDKILCWIAKEDGLKKNVTEIKVDCCNYGELPCDPVRPIGVYDDYCVVDVPEKVIGFLSECED
jgi:hypothetical protein